MSKIYRLMKLRNGRDTGRVHTRATFAAACGLALITFALCTAQSVNPQPPIEYRRVFVPADKIDTWPRDGEKYIPVEARDFEAWIQAANDSTLSGASLATILSAEYTARLDDDGQLRGKGQWSIVLHGDKPAFLPLDRLSLVVRDAKWQNSQEPVRLGSWGRNGHEAERFALQVARSDALNFNWNCPASAHGDQIEIPWRVPNSNSTRLTLDLPPDKRPQIDGSVVLESGPAKPQAAAPGKERRRWVLALTAAPQTLRLVNTNGKTSKTISGVALHEDVQYAVGPRGLDITTTWELDGLNDQERELTVPLPGGLQLTSVKAGGSDLVWHVAQDSSSHSSIAAIKLPKTNGSKLLRLEIIAWQPLVTNETWRLSRLGSDSVDWSSGNLELVIDPSYELQTLETVECVETGASLPKAGLNSPERHTFSAYSPSATVGIRVAPQHPDATIRAGSSLSLADPDLKGRLYTQWNLARGSAHRLTGTLATNWIVEAVETIPADAMGEWFVDRQGKTQQIEIQLSHAATSKRDVSVVVTGRLQRFSLAEPVSLETLRMVDWANARTAQHLLAFQSSDPFAVEPIGNLQVISQERVDTNAVSLLDPIDNSSQIFDLAHAGKNAGLQLRLRRGKYSADIAVNVTYANDELRREYNLTVHPDSNPIDRIIVFATDALGDDVHWVDKKTGAALSAEKLDATDPQRATIAKKGDVWLLRFSQPTSGAVEISTISTSKWQNRAAVPLVSLPEATEQHGHIVVRRANAKSPVLEPLRLQQVPLPIEPRSQENSRQTAMICAAYRYAPAECVDASRAPALMFGPSADRDATALHVRQIELKSYFWPNGYGKHCAVLEIENHGAADFRVDLAPDSHLSGATLDGQALDIAASGKTSQLVIPLVAGLRAAKLALYLETQDPTLAAGRTLSPPLIFDALPYLAGTWTIYVPEDFSVCSSASGSSETTFNWRERLFGWFGRPVGSEPFRFADWSGYLNGLVDQQNIQPPTQSADDVRSGLAPIRALAASPTGDTPGWREFHESFMADRPTSVVVLHPPAITAWTVVAMLSSFLCGRWMIGRHGQALVVALAIAAAIALFLPVAYANFASGAILGLLLSLVAEWPRRAVSKSEPTTHRVLRTAVVEALVLAVAFCLVRSSFAETPKEGVHRVFIPTDAEGRPSGSKYYVSERFLRVLLARGANSEQDASQWTLNDAVYAGELRESSGQPELVAGNWTVTFAIATYARDTVVMLPLNQNDAQWNKTAMLDGVPVPIEWQNEGRPCAVQIAEPGRYSLSFSCVPKTTASNGNKQLELGIPPLLGAKVELRAPGQRDRIVVSNAIMQPQTGHVASAMLTGELNATDRLALQWARPAARENKSQALVLTELRWLHIAPSKADLETKYVLEGGDRQPDSLTLAYDERWNLLADGSSPAEEVAEEDERGMHLVRVRMPIQDTERKEVVLHWQLREPPTLGNFPLPRIEVTSNPINKSWLAVSADPTFECSIADNSAVNGTSGEFLTRWGVSTNADAPQLVLSSSAGVRVNDVTLRPRQTEPTVDEILNVAAAPNTLSVMFQAKVTPSSFGTRRLLLSVPANLSIDEIAASIGDEQLSLRWSRPAENRVAIFLAQTTTKEFRLVVSGKTAVDASHKSQIPRIACGTNDTASQQVRIYRADDVRVELQGIAVSAESRTEPIEPPPAAWPVRPVAVCYLDKAMAAAASIKVEASRHETGGDSLTALTRENGAWFAEYRFLGTVESGELDVLRLQVPEMWTGPFEVQSSAPVATEFTSLDDRRGTLAVRFVTTIHTGGNFDLRIRGPLALASGTAVSVPNIQPEPASRGHRYLYLPESIDSQPVGWTEDGVRAATAPQKLAAGLSGRATAHCVEVVKDPFQVALQPIATPQPTPQIRLVDTVIGAGESGGRLILTRMVLASQGLAECTIQLPAEQRLLCVKLGGQPALVHAVDQSHWQLKLGAPQLPQVLEIVSRSESDAAGRTVNELRRTVLMADGKPIPVEVSLWSFAHPSTSERRLVDGASQISAVEMAASRLDRLVSIAEASKGTADELPSPDGYHWFVPWADLLAGVQSQAQQSIVAARARQAEVQVSRVVEEQIGHASERLNKWLQECRASLSKPDSEPAPESSAGINSQFDSLLNATGAGQWSYYVAEGGDDTLRLELRAERYTATQTRLIALPLIVGLLIATVGLMRTPAAVDFVYRWPHAIGILIGIAYWAWFWPSWLGLLIVVGSVWLALRFDWPGRSVRAEPSTVLRANRST